MAQRIESVAVARRSDGSGVHRTAGRGIGDAGRPEWCNQGGRRPGARTSAAGDRPSDARSGAPNRPWSVGAGRWPPSRACWTRASDGDGAVVSVVGPPGIGKSRLAREIARWRRARDVECVRHPLRIARQPYPLPSRRAAAARGHGRRGTLTAQAARAQVREQIPTPTPRICCSLDDLLGIADPDSHYHRSIRMPGGRRLTALVNTASLARERRRCLHPRGRALDRPGQRVDAGRLPRHHPAHSSLVLITYRPDYRGSIDTDYPVHRR